jgi:hypothetical protein
MPDKQNEAWVIRKNRGILHRNDHIGFPDFESLPV